MMMMMMKKLTGSDGHLDHVVLTDGLEWLGRGVVGCGPILGGGVDDGHNEEEDDIGDEEGDAASSRDDD